MQDKTDKTARLLTSLPLALTHKRRSIHSLLQERTKGPIQASLSQERTPKGQASLLQERTPKGRAMQASLGRQVDFQSSLFQGDLGRSQPAFATASPIVTPASTDGAAGGASWPVSITCLSTAGLR